MRKTVRNLLRPATSGRATARFGGFGRLGLGLLCVALAAPLAVPTTASAGGYDTPILYSARHIGMGGTGIAFVDDPTALFINPAGLAHTDFISLTANFSPILAKADASPCFVGMCAQDQSTGYALAPAFLAGAAFRATDFMTLGIGAYPLASAGGGYESYDIAAGTVLLDETTIRFIEISPGIAFHGKRWSLGFGYRITIAQLARNQNVRAASGNEIENFTLDLSGVDLKGFRVGFQFEPVDGLKVGFVYRHRIDPIVEGDSSRVANTAYGHTEMDLHLPSRLGVGIRGDIPVAPGAYLALATDFEYAFQSQNDFSNITVSKLDANGNPDGTTQDIQSLFNWRDAVTLRLGVEAGIMNNLRVRAGYVFDEQTANKSYASAVGTPPADTHTATVGFGWETPDWEVNLAYAYRNGSYDVTQFDLDQRAEGSRGIGKNCLTCSGLGHHEITLHGIYADFSWYFH